MCVCIDSERLASIPEWSFQIETLVRESFPTGGQGAVSVIYFPTPLGFAISKIRKKVGMGNPNTQGGLFRKKITKL